ncbi:MAG: TIGR01777 family oxidoreductase [Acidobacteriota bacterium]|nr:TIGR01777 family oxidoreductase [Acidobacteriota bacterium]
MSETSSRVVLSGASGLLGGSLRRALEALGIPTLQLVRGATAAQGQLEWNPAVEPAVADTAALEGCAAAVHLSGANVAGHRWTAAYRQEMTTSRVDSTRALASLLAGLRKPPNTLLVASAVGIYGDRDDELLDETSPPGKGFLADLCHEWEAAAQPAVEAGIRVAHLRFGVVLGPGPGALARMLPLFRLGLGGRLGNGRQWMSWISLEDAMRAVLFALETPALAGPVNLTAPRPVTNAEFTGALARQLQRPAFLPAPAFALRLALGQMADEALLASTRAVPSRLLAAGFRFAHPTVDKALAAALP